MHSTALFVATLAIGVMAVQAAPKVTNKGENRIFFSPFMGFGNFPVQQSNSNLPACVLKPNGPDGRCVPQDRVCRCGLGTGGFRAPTCQPGQICMGFTSPSGMCFNYPPAPPTTAATSTTTTTTTSTARPPAP